MFNRVVATPHIEPGGKATACRITAYSDNESLSVLIHESNIIYLISRLADTLSLMQARDADRPCDTEGPHYSLFSYPQDPVGP